MTRDEFNALINKYLDGRATSAEERVINDFIGSQEKRTVAHYRVSEDMWQAIATKIEATKAPRTLQVGKTKSRSYIYKIAAAITLLCVAGAVALYVNYGNALDSTLTWSVSKAQPGQKSIVTLADGTRVHLNSGSSVKYPQKFAVDKREVVLTGEAFFEVTKDAKRPFLIQTGNITTRVLGTSFNIQAFPNENVIVTVATGKVQVEAQVPNEGNNDITEFKRVVLMPNQQVVYSNADESLTAREVDITSYLAWTDNTLYFDDASLEEAVQLLERWYNVDIELGSEAIRNCRINGKYKEQSLTGVLKSIQYMYQVDYTFVTKDNVKLSGKGCDAN